VSKADDARELAGYVAPIVRGTSETLLRRRVKTYDRDTGEVTGEVTMRQVIGGLAEVTKLEIEVIDGKRPNHFTCDTCGKVFEMPKTWTPTTCKLCRTGGQTVCPCGCGKAPPNGAFRPAVVAVRKGGRWTCRREAARRRADAMTPEQRSERSRKANAAMTPEQRSEAARRRADAMTPEQRSERSRKANAAMTPEQRSECHDAGAEIGAVAQG
jgi:hypothetical protein